MIFLNSVTKLNHDGNYIGVKILKLSLKLIVCSMKINLQKKHRIKNICM